MSDQPQSQQSGSFEKWLAAAYPTIQLTPMQRSWIEATERGEQVLWVGGMRSGRTFVASLWREFKDHDELREENARLRSALREIASFSDVGHEQWAHDPAGYAEVLRTTLNTMADVAKAATAKTGTEARP